jgi:hypothetical protein
MIPAPNKSDKIDFLIKSKLDALISGMYLTVWSRIVWGQAQQSHAHEALIELEKIVERISS